MNRFFMLILILIVCFNLFLLSCEPTPSVQTTSREKNAPPLESEEESRINTSLVLESGIYNIPFNATTEEVLRWCTNNNLVVVNHTEKDVKEAARKAVDRIIDLEEAYNFEMASLTPLEEELLKIAQGFAETQDIFELAKVEAAQEKLDVLKNPTISYKGQKYYLEQVHKGMNVYLDNEQKVCKDDRITKTAYKLTLEPSEKSETMIGNGLKSLDVFLSGPVGQEPRAYASLAIFGSSPDRSRDVQFNLTMKGISEKYGDPSWIVGEDNTIVSDDIKLLLGSEFDELYWMDKIAWARNLLLLASLEQVSSTQVELSYRATGFAVLYYDHNAFTRLFELYKAALEDFEKNYYEKNKQALAQIKQDF